MGDILPIVLLLAIFALTAAVLILCLLIVRKNKVEISSPAEDKTAELLNRQAVEQKLFEQTAAQLLARINELEQRLNSSQNQTSGQIHQQIARLNTQVGAVDENMQHLQRLFRNVKLRGSWGEVQLAAILSQMLSPSQYDTNVAIDPESRECVEFALKLPLDDNTYLWLPIDAKCPIEDFERLQAAEEQANREEAEKAARSLCRRLTDESRDIAEKYIRPPYSTDFALLFLPIESIYQWVLSQPALVQEMERKYRVIPTSPATVSAVLNLVQLSHKSLAISQSEGEVWRYLGNVRQEMANFDAAVGKSQKKAAEITNNLDNLARRLRVLERRLNEIEGLPQNIPDTTSKEKPLD